MGTTAGLLLLLHWLCLGQAQLFGENMFADSKESPLMNKVTIDADMMDDMDMSESQLTEQQLKIRDFYRY
jgi:hypothetical protein